MMTLVWIRIVQISCLCVSTSIAKRGPSGKWLICKRSICVIILCVRDLTCVSFKFRVFRFRTWSHFFSSHKVWTSSVDRSPNWSFERHKHKKNMCLSVVSSIQSDRKCFVSCLSFQTRHRFTVFVINGFDLETLP